MPYGHEASAVLLHNGSLICAAEEERFSRHRHAPRETPDKAVRFCLKRAHISAREVDLVARGWQSFQPPFPPLGRASATILQEDEISSGSLPRWWPSGGGAPVYHVRHHVAHLAAAFYSSGFEDAACLIVDGRGEAESITLAEITETDLRLIRSYPGSASLGRFYEAATMYAGFRPSDCGKLMGLAPYGRAGAPGWIRANPRTGEVSSALGKLADNIGTFQLTSKWLEHFRTHSYPYAPGPVGGAALDYADFAASVQGDLTAALLNLAQYLRRRTRSRNLVLGGGVALNCPANASLIHQGLYENVFAHPASNDAGVSLGAAYEASRVLGHEIRRDSFLASGSLLGFSSEVAAPLNESFLRRWGAKRFPLERLAMLAARELAENRIVAVSEGRAEFGPRALGARSLLANPAYRSNLPRLNHVKGREPWRPLAPAVLEEESRLVFEGDLTSEMFRFMLCTVRVRPAWRGRVPAIVHADGTSRPQIVAKGSSLLARTLAHFRDLTGLPLLVNTSFNLKGSPLVNTPREALRAFADSPLIDTMILDSYILQRYRGRSRGTRLRRNGHNQGSLKSVGWDSALWFSQDVDIDVAIRLPPAIVNTCTFETRVISDPILAHILSNLDGERPLAQLTGATRLPPSRRAKLLRAVGELVDIGFLTVMTSNLPEVLPHAGAGPGTAIQPARSRGVSPSSDYPPTLGGPTHQRS